MHIANSAEFQKKSLDGKQLLTVRGNCVELRTRLTTFIERLLRDEKSFLGLPLTRL
ncbi:hypothetical protein NIES2104_32470 [Leptolyngbya sp. NIES-2104]|nr:hypothetical protein NIES2104_32470 [Leptolyngbya sp. NIES-2104]